MIDLSKKEILQRFGDKISLTTYQDEWLVIFEGYDMKYVEFQERIKEELGKETSFNDLVEVLTGNKNNWGLASEFTTCHICNKAIETTTTHKPDFFLDERNTRICCGDCVREEEAITKDYIEHLTNNYKSANTILTSNKLESFGFELYNKGKEFEFGVHNDSEIDDPEHLLSKLQSEGYEEVIFDIIKLEQFTTTWKAWVK